MRGADLYFRICALKFSKESRKVSKADRARDSYAENFRAQFKARPQRFHRILNSGENCARPRIQRRARGCQCYRSRRAFKQGRSKARFHAGDLSSDGGLSEAGGLACFGEIAMFGDEMKKLQLVKIERASGEQFIHRAHYCKAANEFPAMPGRGEDLRVWQIEMTNRRATRPDHSMWILRALIATCAATPRPQRSSVMMKLAQLWLVASRRHQK